MQLTYTDNPAAGFEGMIAEPFSQEQVDSYLVEGAAIKFGAAVILGTDKTKQISALADGVGDIFGGVVVGSLCLEVDGDASGSPEYAVKAMAPVMLRGRIWVRAAATVTVGARVYPTVADSQEWGVTALTNCITEAYARTAGDANDLIMIELRGPVRS